MSNPKGNPNIVNYGFKTDRAEPLKERVQIRVPASLKKKLQAKDNWQEFARQALQKALELESA